MKTSFSSSDWTWMCKIVPESFCSPANANCPECTNKYSLFYGDDKNHDGRRSTGSPEMQTDIRELTVIIRHFLMRYTIHTGSRERVCCHRYRTVYSAYLRGWRCKIYSTVGLHGFAGPGWLPELWI